MPRPAVFVSYSHLDKKWLEDLRTMLAPMVRNGIVDVWWDGEIKPSQEWRQEIEAALASARVAVLLVSRHFLASDFIVDEELRYLLDAAQRRQVKILWALVGECLYEETPLQGFQALHDVKRPLNSLTEAELDRVLKEICQKIAKAVNGEAAANPREPIAAPIHLDIDRLPRSGPLFVGREAEIQRLKDAWEDTSTHVLTFVAFGGVGKSALVGRWLDDMAADGWHGALRVLAWSFYSQGTADRVLSAEPFLDYALGFFGDPDFTGAPRDRGLRLAELVRREKTLLVLDGVEPLQHPPGPRGGQFKDPGLAAFLKSLAGSNLGLCVVTTRERIADLDTFPKTAPQVDLKTLSQEAGAALLRQLGVQGKDSELRAAAGDFGGHSLALTLLGTYLRDVYKGDVRRRKEVPLLDEGADEDGHARRVLASYAAWLQEPEMEVLRLLGFFDRAATSDRVAALRVEPAIAGLTEHIGPKEEARFQKAVARLRQARLLEEGEKPGSLEAHALVRVYFQEELERERPAAWQEGNLRLYEHLKGSAPELPETLEAMEPLYTAVLHGCRAGRQPEALDEVYWRRILRGEKHFSWKKLGAFGSDLAALSGFFDRPWDTPSAQLSAADQAFVLNEAAICLRSLGRLAEAVPPMQAGLERCIAQEDWKNAAIAANNLSELAMTLGEVGRAVAFGERSGELADKTGDHSWRMASRTVLADALLQAGRWEESAEVFREAEALQAEWQPEYPRLYSMAGYRYCDLLLSQGAPEAGAGLNGLAATQEAAGRFRQACREVQERARQTLEWASKHLGLLDIALDHLSLGRAHLGLALPAPVAEAPGEAAEVDFAQAAEHLGCAVEGLRQAAEEGYLTRGLLARAAYYRLMENPVSAAADLSEALEIADRGGMRLNACDAHLEWARLELQQGNTEKAREHVVKARQLVNETGYKRREREVAWLEGRVGVPGSAGVSPAG